MKVSVVLSLVALKISTITAQKVVPFDIQKHPKSRALAKRQSPVFEPLGNAQDLYFANITVGTPPQLLQLQVDTGSSDVWMTQTGVAFCQQSQYNCLGGTFAPAQSSSYNALSTPFNISYEDQTGSTGNFFTDTFTIGQPSITLNGLQMGLATQTTIGTGIIGVGFAADESVCTANGPCATYPSIIDQMVAQGKINSRAYSLWLNDLEASTGSILFGGVDTDKYTGSLVTLPIQPDSQTNSITSFTVAFTGFTIGTAQGTRTGFTPSNYVSPAILDSGTTLTLLPNDIATAVFKQTGASYSRQVGAYIVPCTLGGIGATFNFQFGGANGPTIQVPITEMVSPATNAEGNPLKFTNGQAACQFGIEPAGDNPVLFGDTFLRSAYVVYDLDNQQVSIAQTDFNATSSNVKAIAAGAGGVPGVASTADGASAAQTVTGIPRGGTQAATGTVATATDVGSYTTDPPLISLASGNAGAAATGAAATSAGAAAAVTVPSAGFGGLIMLSAVFGFIALGGCIAVF